MNLLTYLLDKWFCCQHGVALAICYTDSDSSQLWVYNLSTVHRCDYSHINEAVEGSSEKIVIPRPAYGFVTDLMEYVFFTFTFASREFPPTCVCCIVCDSIGDLALWPFDQLIGSRVTLWSAANFGLSRPFRSRVRSRHATDRHTDGRTDRHRQSFYNASPYGGRASLSLVFNTGLRAYMLIAAGYTRLWWE